MIGTWGPLLIWRNASRSRSKYNAGPLNQPELSTLIHAKEQDEKWGWYKYSLGSYSQPPCAGCLVQLKTAPPGPSGSLLSTGGWQLEGRLSLWDLLICCSTRGAGSRDDNAYAGIQLQGCLFPRWELTLTAENSMLHLLQSLGKGWVVCKSWGCGIMLYSQQKNIQHVEWDFARLTCNLSFFLFSKPKSLHNFCLDYKDDCP